MCRKRFKNETITPLRLANEQVMIMFGQLNSFSFAKHRGPKNCTTDHVRVAMSVCRVCVNMSCGCGSKVDTRPPNKCATHANMSQRPIGRIVNPNSAGLESHLSLGMGTGNRIENGKWELKLPLCFDQVCAWPHVCV